jgi:hypothetical protein
MSIILRLRGRLNFYRLRLNQWLQLRAVRKAVYLRNICAVLLDAEMRFLKSNQLQLGEDDELDNIVEYVSRYLTTREIPPDLQHFAGENLVSELLLLSQHSAEVKNVIARYHAANAYFAGFFGDEVRKKSQLGLARTTLPEIAEYDSKAVSRECSISLARLGKLRKQLAERSALKVEFSIAGVSGSIALVIAIFVVAGFLYIHYFYRQMGVDVSLYFSVSDYLAASVEQIRTGSLAAAVSIGTFAFGVRAGSLRSRLQLRADANARLHKTRLVVGVTLILILANLCLIYLGKPDFSLLRLTCVILSYWISDYIAGAFFRNQLVAMTALVGTMVFGANVGVAAYERTEQLLNADVFAPYLQRVHFKDATPPAVGELFGANSSYYFIYERNKGVTHVVPRERVAQIDITKRTR